MNFGADLHFHHKNILSFGNRPYTDIDEMNKGIVSDLNECVNGGKFYHLGDLSFSGINKTREIVKQFDFELYVIKGNHDNPKHMKALDEEFSNFHYLGDYHELKIDGQKVVLFHYPITAFNGQGRGSIQLFGHCHGSLDDRFNNGKSMDVGYDNLMNIGIGRPCISWEEIKEIMDNREIVTYDHHKIVKVLE